MPSLVSPYPDESCRDTILSLYRRYHDPRWLAPDPLVIVRRYSTPQDQEVAGLVAAALALGNATLIMKAAGQVLDPFGDHPASAMASTTQTGFLAALEGFRYRFFNAGHLAALLYAASSVRRAYGSLEAAFLACAGAASAGVPGPAGHSGDDYTAAASGFVRVLRAHGAAFSGGGALSPVPSAGASEKADPARDGAGRQTSAPWPPNLLPDPLDGSAAKRTFLYLRWMIRRDAVDPGPWTKGEPSRLVVPLDTHMAAACRRLGILRRATVDLKAAREVTAYFRGIEPSDPVRFDFSLTRPGIRPDLDADACFDTSPDSGTDSGTDSGLAGDSGA